MSQFSFLCQFSSNPIESLQPSTVDSDCKIAEVASIKRFQNRLDSRLVLTALLPVQIAWRIFQSFIVRPLQRRHRRNGDLRTSFINLINDGLFVDGHVQYAAYPHIIQRFMSGVISQKAHIEAWLIEYLKIGIAFKRGNIR